jgi:hypothetical protein
VLETTSGAQYGTPGERGFFLQKTVGTAHRQRLYDRALEAFRNNKIEAFGINGSSFQIYILGLVDKVGWETYQKAFRSYNDKTFTPQKFTTTGRAAQARDLFDRIEHFGGKPGVLRTLPDRGVLLDKHFGGVTP